MSYFKAEILAANHLVLSSEGGTAMTVELIHPLEGTMEEIDYLEGTMEDD